MNQDEMYARVTLVDYYLPAIPREFMFTYHLGQSYEVSFEEYLALTSYKGLVTAAELNPKWRRKSSRRKRI